MKNIIIFGGGLGNKGAQSMTYICVHECRERFPEAEIYVVSDTDIRKNISDANYRFHLIPTPHWKKGIGGASPTLRLLLRSVRKNKAADALLQNTVLMLDISGYALGSNWGFDDSFSYLAQSMLAKAYQIPYYIMPQSMGPFAYTKANGYTVKQRLILHRMLRELLPYPKIIFAREQAGYDALIRTFHLKNVQKHVDMVLNHRGFAPENIFITVPEMNLPEIAPHSVAIIPNSQNTRYGNIEEILKAYQSSIRLLLEQGKTVYLLRHSFEDLELCRTIKGFFAENAQVICLAEEFSCMEYNTLVSAFDFVIASRFHSIVHAYKQAVPCIAVGWAEKYRVLLGLFGQERYFFDVRHGLSETSLLEAVLHMLGAYPEEKAVLGKTLHTLQEKNIFDKIQVKESYYEN